MDLRIHDAGLERSDRKSIASLQLKKLKALLLRAWETNSFYRDHWRRAGTSLDQVASLSDFAARFPLVRKGDFIADQRLAPPFGRRAAHALSNRAPYPPLELEEDRLHYLSGCAAAGLPDPDEILGPAK